MLAMALLVVLDSRAACEYKRCIICLIASRNVANESIMHKLPEGKQGLNKMYQGATVGGCYQSVSFQILVQKHGRRLIV